MNVFAVSSKNRPASDKPTDNRKTGLQNGQTERDHRNGYRNQGRGLLRALQSQRAQHEPDEKTSAIAEKDRGWAEIKTEKAQNRARQSQRHERNQRSELPRTQPWWKKEQNPQPAHQVHQ